MTDIQQYTAAEIANIETVKEAVKVKGMADAAVEFYKAQDDHQTSQKAKEISMRSARRAGEILATVPRDKGGYSSHGGMSTTEYQQAIEGAGIPATTAHNWQKIASVDNSKFETYFAEAEYSNWEYSVYSLLRFANDGVFSSDLNDWETPQWLFDLLNKEFKFTLDVCANKDNAKCKRYYTPKDNGLEQDWKGTCWMNPPYGDAIPAWIQKAKEEASKGTTVVCLVPARTDTEWWWNNCIYGEVRFLKGRLKFGNSVNSAPFPSAVVILGPAMRRKVVWWNVGKE